MNTNLALAAQNLQRAAYARFAFVGQRDSLNAASFAAIDHQLVQRVTNLRDAYIAAGGLDDAADDAIKTGARNAADTLDD